MQPHNQELQPEKILPFKLIEVLNLDNIDSWEEGVVHKVPSPSLAGAHDYYLSFTDEKNNLNYQIKLDRDPGPHSKGVWWGEFKTQYGFARTGNTDGRMLYSNFGRLLKTIKNTDEDVKEIRISGATIDYSVKEMQEVEHDLRMAGFVGVIPYFDFQELNKIYKSTVGRNMNVSVPRLGSAIARMRLARRGFYKYYPSWTLVYNEGSNYLEAHIPDDF